jgi:hypothetical protein
MGQEIKIIAGWGPAITDCKHGLRWQETFLRKLDACKFSPIGGNDVD